MKPEKEKATWSAARLQHEIDQAIQHGSTLLGIPGGTYRFANQTSLLVTRASSLILEPQGRVELIFSGDEGVNFQHCTDVTFGSLGKDDDENDKAIAIDYDPLPPPEPNFAEKSGITLNMFNCTHMKTYNVVIRAAPFIAVTAFNGGGGHLYQNIRFVPRNNTLASVRDALHFTDLREGPTVKDSIIGFSGDDFFNVHTTLLVVLECSHSNSMCTLINPHVTMGAKRNSVYGTFSLLSHVQKGDILSFYKWPNEDMIIRRIPNSNDSSNTQTNQRDNYTIRHLHPETDPTVLAKAAKMPARTAVSHGWISLTNRTTNYTAEEVWQVHLDTPPPRTVQPGDLVAVDTINCAGAKFIHNTFLNSGCNVGRMKASNVLFQDNFFQHARVPNLEISVLPQWFEGPVEIQDVRFENNIFAFSSKGGKNTKKAINPIHCGPLCEKPGCEFPPACSTCPDCLQDTPWAKHVVFVNNSFLPEKRTNDDQSESFSRNAGQPLEKDS